MSKRAYVKPYPKEFRDQVVVLVQASRRRLSLIGKDFDLAGLSAALRQAG